MNKPNPTMSFMDCGADIGPKPGTGTRTIQAIDAPPDDAPPDDAPPDDVHT